MGDADDPAWAQVARMKPPDGSSRPDSAVRCWSRVAVVAGDQRLGLLAVDCWTPNALKVIVDETTIEAFAMLIAVGLAANTESFT